MQTTGHSQPAQELLQGADAASVHATRPGDDDERFTSRQEPRQQLVDGRGDRGVDRVK